MTVGTRLPPEKCRLRSILWLFVMLLCPASVRAEKLISLVRGEGTGADRAAVLVGHFLREEFIRNERYETLDLAKVLGNPDRDQALKSFQAAEALAEEGRRAYDKLELDTAAHALARVLAEYGRAPAYVQDFQKVAETMMLLGATRILRGDEKGGGACLEGAIAVFPQVEPDPRTFNPAMRIQFAEAQARLGVKRAGLVSISSAPGYAEAYVDGKFRGATPLTVTGLSPGPHYLRVEREGYRPWGKVVTVQSALEASHTATLVPTVHFEQFDAWAEAAVRRVGDPRPSTQKASHDLWGKFGTQLGTELLALTEVRLDGERVLVHIELFDVRTHVLRKTLKHTFSYESDLTSYAREMAGLLRNTAGLGPAIAPAAQTPSRHPARDPILAQAETPTRQKARLPHAGEVPLCAFGLSCDTVRKTVGTGGIVLGATGFGLAAWQYLAAKASADTYRQAIQVLPATQALRARGRAQALRGDIFLGVGSVLAVAGVTTLLAWDPQPTVAQALDAQAMALGSKKLRPIKRVYNFDLEPSRSGVFLALRGTL